MQAIVRTLRASGQLKKTVIVMMGDNGYLLGQHRISMGKYFPYEPALQDPVRDEGSGDPFGRRGRPAGVVDRRDAHPAGLRGSQAGRASTRWHVAASGAVRETTASASGPCCCPAVRRESPNGTNLPLFDGVRTPAYAWWRYEDGFEEMYDLRNDPDELTNIAQDPAYAEIRDELVAEWERLKDCSGKSCRVRSSAP